ncbi:hypothetical protein [Phytomonospora endophytica]|uniref:Uncharacterized protein n=1 Tax=Phytomonospora endophytica TaxID=714109 RepID=A0A841FT68_9ACTN|nr:hypothetical protein [Phytomonospora endophytica]MBB6036507.1 hypothetical protein [Phytomonospora endophytica]GIG65829.1 hypothetical protein Pen01_21240 [Phytomonospora endophytica]
MDPFHTLRRRRRVRDVLKTAFGITLTVIVCGLLITVGLARAGVIDLPVGDGGSDSAGPSDEASGPSSPFDGTPAAEFGTFAELKFPKAKATKRFGKNTVADALDTVRDMIEAGRVDWPSKPQKPAAFAKRFAPSQRDDIAEILGGSERLAYVSAILDGRSLVAEPRVTGSISVKEKLTANTVRVLEIRTNLVWAYGFDGPLLAPGDNLLVLNTQQVWQFGREGEVRPEDEGLWPADTGYFAQNIECGHFDDGFLSAYRADPAQYGEGTPSGDDPDAAFDPELDLSKVGDDCH